MLEASNRYKSSVDVGITLTLNLSLSLTERECGREGDSGLLVAEKSRYGQLVLLGTLHGNINGNGE